MSALTDTIDRADAYAQQLEGITQRANDRGLSTLRADLAEAKRVIVVDWMVRFGSVDVTPTDLASVAAFSQAATARLLAVLDVAGPPAERALRQEMLTAFTVGVDHGLESNPFSGLRVHVDDPAPGSLGITEPLLAQRAKTVTALTPAQVLAQGFPSVTGATAQVERAASRIEAVNAWSLTRSASDGTTAVARAVGAARMWVAERDGCVHCLAYSGFVTMNSAFPTGLTFGERPISPRDLLTGPPLHPHCRCSLELLDPAADLAISDALKREAKRSVLRGFSLPSESEQVRLRAADRLLAQGAGLPKTVEQYAERAVRRGSFPTRDVPAGA